MPDWSGLPRVADQLPLPTHLTVPATTVQFFNGFGVDVDGFANVQRL